MNAYYWFDKNHKPYAVGLFEWAKKYESENRVISRDTVGDADVSTVFLGVDHRYGPGPPVLWETLIFGGAYDGNMWRYTSYEAAAQGHVNVVKCLMVGLEPDAITDDG
jgi:hypothetical protein